MKWFKDDIGEDLRVITRLKGLQRSVWFSLRLYYLGGMKPLEADMDDLATMSGLDVRRKADREALEKVLRQHFELSPDGTCYHHPEWDRRIANYQRGAPEEEAREEQRQSSNSERQKRLRARKKLLRDALTDNGISTPGDIGMDELRALCVQHLGQTVTDALADVDGGGDADAVTPPVTSPVTPVTPPLKPVTTNHQPSTTPTASAGGAGGVGGGDGEGVTPNAVTAAVTPLREASRSDAVRSVAAELTAQGLLVHHTDADLQRLVGAGWTAATILKQKPAAGWSGVRAPMAWVVGKLANKGQAGAALPPPEGDVSADGWPATRSGVEAIATRLGIALWSDATLVANGETYANWERRVRAEAERRKECVA